jgi:hypothetical protein
MEKQMNDQVNHTTSQAPVVGNNTPGVSPDGREPVQQLRDRGIHGDNETTGSYEALQDEYMNERARASSQGALPIWLSEKYHWVEGADKRSRLQPNPEFLKAVAADAPKFIKYGNDKLSPESTEFGAANDISAALTMVIESLRGFDESDREQGALKRYVTERATSNLVYAAITQFEIDNWAARAAAQGRNASDHQNFGQKQARRDEFAINGVMWLAIGRQLFADFPLVVSGNPAQLKATHDQLERQAKSLIFQQARIQTQQLTSPNSANVEEQQNKAAAVAVSRPI